MELNFNKFGNRLLKDIIDNGMQNDIQMISPYSLAVPFLQMKEFASERTKSEIENLLGKDEKFVKKYFRMYEDCESIDMHQAYWLHPSYFVNSDFLHLCIKSESKIGFLKLKDINDWVKEKTDNKIQTLLDSVDGMKMGKKRFCIFVLIMMDVF